MARQARTSTIRPLKISSAFWINGSFLKSSWLNGTASGLFAADAAGLTAVRRAVALTAGGGEAVSGGKAGLASASVWMNLIWTLG